MRMLSVPEGTWSGASGVPTPHLIDAWGAWQRSRFAERVERSLNVAQRTRPKISRDENVLRLVTAYDRDASRRKNILFSFSFSGPLLLSKRQRLQELLLALKTWLARPSPQPLNGKATYSDVPGSAQTPRTCPPWG